MASLTGAVNNGVYTKTQASVEATAADAVTTTSKSADAKKTEYDQEMFLQLLVAEMQYQDPLEPTSNTEYVSELASFSQIEAIQNVQDQMQTIQADSLVGKYVILLEDGEYISGKVDYVENDEGELKLAVNNQLYEISKLDSVVDEQYYNAVLTAEAFTDIISRLPELSSTTLADEDSIATARQIYDGMDDYAKKYVSSDTALKLSELEKRIAALKNSDSVSDNNNEGNSDTATV